MKIRLTLRCNSRAGVNPMLLKTDELCAAQKLQQEYSKLSETHKLNGKN